MVRSVLLRFVMIFHVGHKTGGLKRVSIAAVADFKVWGN